MRGGPLALSELAKRLEVTPDAAERLLLAAASLKLVEKRGVTASGEQRFGLGMQGAALLGNPGAIAMIEHHALFYADLENPVALLRGEGQPTRLSRYWAYATASDPAVLDAADSDDYTALMASSQPLVSADILHAYDFGKHRRLLDVGGGNGAFLRAVGSARPDLKLDLFDLPQVVGKADALFEKAGMAGRATSHGGDFKRDALPQGADIVLPHPRHSRP